MNLLQNIGNFLGNRALAAKAYLSDAIKNKQQAMAENNINEWKSTMPKSNYQDIPIEQTKNTIRNVQSNMVPITNPTRLQAARVNVQTQPIQRTNSTQNNYDDLINNTFGDQAKIARAILLAESQGDYSRIGDKHLMFNSNGEQIGDSVGGFQIRTGGNEGGTVWNRARANGMTADEFRKKMLIPEENIKYAKQIYDRYGWNPWSTYSQGTYKNYLK